MGERFKLTAGINGILPALRTGPCQLFRCSLEPPVHARSKQVTELWCLITAVFVPHTAPIKHQSRPQVSCCLISEKINPKHSNKSFLRWRLTTSAQYEVLGNDAKKTRPSRKGQSITVYVRSLSGSRSRVTIIFDPA
jgi:hypothetical protein